MDLPEPYYADGSVTIYHGDCRDILPTLDTSALVVTDPPYGISLNNDWQNKVHEGRSVGNLAKGGIEYDDGSVDFAGLVRPFSRRVVFGFPYLADADMSGWLVWDKEPGFSGRSLTSPVEMAYATTWRGFKAVRLLWSGYMREPGSEAKVGHPTQKPERLMRTVINWHDDALIIDPCMGSGTTLRAAKDLGRRAIGIELEERYCEIAVKRLAQEVLC